MASTPASLRRSRTVLLLLALGAAERARADELATITGVVRDEGGDGIGGAVAVLEDMRGSLLRTAVADARGAFEMVDLTPGDYILDATAPGRFADRKLVRLRGGDRLTIELVCESASVVQREGARYEITERAAPFVLPLGRATTTVSS